MVDTSADRVMAISWQPMRYGKHLGYVCFSAVSNFPLMAQIAQITQTLTTKLIGYDQPAKNETDTKDIFYISILI